MPLYRLVYFSRLSMASPARPAVIDAITRVGRINNEAHAITSALVIGGDRVLQVIEGRRGSVNALFSRIARDARHTGVELLEVCPADERQFAPWSLVFVDVDEMPMHTVRRYSPGSDFEPSLMTPTTALQFLRTAAHHATTRPSLALENDDIVAV
jgi:hypothetical protein